MSVFQLKDWWSAKSCSTGEEEMDMGSMALGNVDNAIPASQKIVLGSLQGVLRVFAPTKANFRVEDLVHEEYMGAPILQVAVGRFLPASPDYLGIAVLHPRKLCVYEMLPHDNSAGKAVYFTLAKAYEHELGVDGKHFTAFNMVVGPFGGVSGKDLIMVQSMHGRLQVFEQTASAFTRQLADCLLPAPLLYMKRMDAFVIASYTSRVECYKYQVLVNAQGDIGTSSSNGNNGNNSEAAAQGLHASRTAVVEWSVNLGETCLQLVEGRFLGADKRAADEILALTERSLVLIKESGVVIQQRRLDKEPACLCAYAAAPGMGHNFVVAYRDGTLQIYSEFNLVWAVTAEISPVQIAVADFGSQKGLVTSVSEHGQLLVGYLGTRPPVTAIGGYKRELDYDKVDEEHRQLLQVIRESQSETKSEPRDMLVLRSQMSKTLDTRPLDHMAMEGGDFAKPPPDCAVYNNGAHDVIVRTTLRLFVSYSSPRPASNISVVINTPAFVTAVPSSVVISQLSGTQSTPTIIHVTLYSSKMHLPASLDAQAVATYVTASGEPRVAVHSIQLPLFLACHLKPPAKNNVYKLTLECPSASHPLPDLFTDFLAASQDAGIDVSEVFDASGGLAMGFQFWCHMADTASRVAAKDSAAVNALYQQCSASIIMAKSGGKYRVQSDCLGVLNVLVAELSRRVSVRSREIGTSNTKGQPHRFHALSFLDSIPLEPYFAVIGEHFNTRLKLQEVLSRLNDQSHQFRVIEKRLLTRFKDKNPSPLTGLDLLLRETYQSVLQLSDSADEHKVKLQQLFAELEGLSRLMALLATLRYDLNPMEHEALNSYLCPDLSEGEDLGWEEMVEASVTYLLKTTLAKNAKDFAPVQHTISIPDDTEKLTKHISMMFDRIAKGAKLIKLKSPNQQQPRDTDKKSSAGTHQSKK